MWQPKIRHARIFVALLLALVGFVVAPLPALAQGEQPDGDTAEIAKWFTTYGLPIVRSQAADVFDNDISADVDELSLGTPQRALAVDDKPGASAKPTTAFVPSDRWVAPIMQGDTAVGALIAVGKVGNKPSETDVVADIRLATEASNPRGTIRDLIYDEENKAWFVYRNEKIEPADSAGENYVLGSIPFDSFIEQRQNFTVVDTATATSQTAATAPAQATTTSRSVGIFAALFGLGLLVIFSLAWLRWDQLHSNEARLASDSYKNVVLARVRNRWDPFAQARLLIHPQKHAQSTTTPPPSNENLKEEK